MGKIERQISEGVTKYYWYPGEKIDWIRGALTLLGGGLLFALIFVVTKNSLIAAVVAGTAVQAVVGAYLGRRDAAGLEGLPVPLRVAVMGCVVNGPGEAREADLGVASGNGKGQIFVKGEVIRTVPESQIVETLIEEAIKLAEAMGADLPEELKGLAGPVVQVH